MQNVQQESVRRAAMCVTLQTSDRLLLLRCRSAANLHSHSHSHSLDRHLYYIRCALHFSLQKILSLRLFLSSTDVHSIPC